MAFSIDLPIDLPVPSYIIYRDTPAGRAYDPTAPPVFFPPKDSDELFDALRTKFPHLRSHSERLRDAMIEFLLEERQAELGQNLSAMPAMSAETSTTSPCQLSWPSMSSDSSSLWSSPDTFTLTTSTFGDSLQPHLLHLTRQASTAGSATATPSIPESSPAVPEHMTGVFSLDPSAQPKQRVRRKMTESEKAEYRKRRIVKACDKCAKRKRKCHHSESEMDRLAAKSTKVAKPRVQLPYAMTVGASVAPKQHDTLLDVSGRGCEDVFAADIQLFDDFTNFLEEPWHGVSLDWSTHFDHRSSLEGGARVWDGRTGGVPTRLSRHLQNDVVNDRLLPSASFGNAQVVTANSPIAKAGRPSYHTLSATSSGHASDEMPAKRWRQATTSGIPGYNTPHGGLASGPVHAAGAHGVDRQKQCVSESTTEHGAQRMDPRQTPQARVVSASASTKKAVNALGDLKESPRLLRHVPVNLASATTGIQLDAPHLNGSLRPARAVPGCSVRELETCFNDILIPSQTHAPLPLGGRPSHHYLRASTDLSRSERSGSASIPASTLLSARGGSGSALGAPGETMATWSNGMFASASVPTSGRKFSTPEDGTALSQRVPAERTLRLASSSVKLRRLRGSTPKASPSTDDWHNPPLWARRPNSREVQRYVHMESADQRDTWSTEDKDNVSIDSNAHLTPVVKKRSPPALLPRNNNVGQPANANQSLNQMANGCSWDLHRQSATGTNSLSTSYHSFSTKSDTGSRGPLCESQQSRLPKRRIHLGRSEYERNTEPTALLAVLGSLLLLIFMCTVVSPRNASLLLLAILTPVSNAKVYNYWDRARRLWSSV